MQGKRVLITGGAGFLGTHIAEEFLKQGMEVRTLDLEPSPESLHNIDHIQADIRDVNPLRQAFSGVEVVVHAAAALPLWKKKDIFEVNVQGTRNVLSMALELGISRVVHISSTAVYGVPRKHPIIEDDPKVGVGAYGESKIQAEAVCHEYRQRGLCVPILRPKTFIGTGRLGVFQILFDWVQKGARIPIIGSGDNRYQLLEVQDLVQAVILALRADAEKANDDFNVGAERFGTVREDVGALCGFAASGAKVLGTPALPVKALLRLLESVKLSPLYQWVYDTADKDSFVSIEKIQRSLGWKPRLSNAEALIHTYSWYNTAYQEYRGGIGVTHRVAWDQGALALARRLMGGRK